MRVLRFSVWGLIVGTVLLVGCSPPELELPPDWIWNPDSVAKEPGVMPRVAVAPVPEGQGWYMLAASIDLGALIPSPGPEKSFDSLATEVQDGLINILDEGEAGHFDIAFFPTGEDTQVISTAIGFVRESAPLDWHAYGFPALVIHSDPYMPIGISPTGPVVAIKKATLDALTGQVGQLLTDAASQVPDAMPPAPDTEPQEGEDCGQEFEDVISTFLGELDTFFSKIEGDDASDGSISQEQQFSLSIPCGGISVLADLTFDLDSTEGGARWLGGIGVDITATVGDGPDSSESISLEMAVGQQRLSDDVNVIMLEAGPGTIDLANPSRLAGEWLAPIAMEGLLITNTLTLTDMGDEDYTTEDKARAVPSREGSPGQAMHRRMAHATEQILAALTSRPSQVDPTRAQVIEPPPQDGMADDEEEPPVADADTLWVKLHFDDNGAWTDLSAAPGVEDEAPADHTFQSIHSAIDMLEGQLEMDLPAVELRVSATSDGFVRLDVIVTDLIIELMRSLPGSLGIPMDLDTEAVAIPDLSLLTIGGVLSEGHIDGQAVILLFVEDVHFERK